MAACFDEGSGSAGAGAGAGKGKSAFAGDSGGGPSIIMGSPYAPPAPVAVMDAATQLLPIDKRTLTWSLVVSNTEFMQSMMTLVKPALDKNLSFVIQRRKDGMSDLLINALRQDGSLFAAVRLACDARFYDDRGVEQPTGEERVTVDFKGLKRCLRRMGGNMNLAMYQQRAGSLTTTNLLVRVLEGGRCRKFDLGTLVDEPLQFMPQLKFQHNLYLPVLQLREDLIIASEVASEGEGHITIELCIIPGAPLTHMLFVLGARGVGGHPIEMCTYVCPAPDLGPSDVVDNVHARARSAIDATAATRTTTVFREDSKDLPRLYSGKFKPKEFLKILTDMRSEAYIDLFVGRAPDDTTLGKMPLLLRMSGGPDLCMHFVIPHIAENGS